MAVETATITNSIQAMGRTYSKIGSVTGDVGVRIPKTLAVAKIGQLTTRTDNDTGTLTMNASHGIITGDRLDLFWSTGGGGARYGMTVGTVSGNSVPIDLGAGDNLPTLNDAITAFVPVSESIVVTGNNVSIIIAQIHTGRGIIVFADSGNAALFTGIESESSSGVVYLWDSSSGITNPLAGDALAKVFFSNGESATTREAEVVIFYN